uniref:Uncharacterized protein n=1 Tax=Arundo donax TaxID=35708 RepID=A0A0A8ZGE1_ARUDO
MVPDQLHLTPALQL